MPVRVLRLPSAVGTERQLVKIFRLIHKVKNPAPGVAIVMIVAVEYSESADDARLLAADRRGLESPNAWLDPVASSCELISWSAWGTDVERGVLCVQKAEKTQ